MMDAYARIGDVCLVGDGTHSKIERHDCGVLYLTSRNFKDGSLDLSKVYYISERDYVKHFLGEGKALTLPRENDLVFSIIGTIGEPYLVRESDRFGISSSVAIIRPNRDFIDPTFLLHWFKGPVFQSALFGIKGGVAQGYVSLEMIRSLPVPTLPLQVQQRIANIFSAYDELIENNQRRIRILEDMARNLYREWFVHFRYPGHESVPLVDSSLGQIPKRWSVKKLNDICSKLIDGTHDSPPPAEAGYPLITGRHIKGGFIDFSDAYLISPEEHEKVMKRSRPEIGDIIYSNIGTLGATALVDQHFEYSIKNVALLKPFSWFHSAFLYCYLESPENLRELTQKASGTSQKFFSLQFLRAVELTVPPSELLELFAAKLTPIISARSILNNQIQNLRHTRDLLLPRLLSGQVTLATAPPPIYDEDKFKRMVEKGTQAWAGVPDSAAWVETLRGSKE